MHVDDVPTVVRQHFDCGDQNLQYISWSWDLAGGPDLHNHGCIRERNVASAVSDLPAVGNCMTDKTWLTSVQFDDASEIATRHTFQ